ncbi:hypothetical protein OHA88_40235 [Streptomyces sp. NBC_00353]|uniref:hypothetical protein n=1 Tax=Streptomyces sp. NBC_00353 TaxID=2975722 RepID=UPI002E25B4A4
MRPAAGGVNAAFPKYFEEVKREIYVWYASELRECDPWMAAQAFGAGTRMQRLARITKTFRNAVCDSGEAEGPLRGSSGSPASLGSAFRAFRWIKARSGHGSGLQNHRNISGSIRVERIASRSKLCMQGR